MANRTRYTGTHLGEWMEVPPTGREVVIRGLTIDEYRDGRLIEATISNDLERIADHLGARVQIQVLEDVSSPGQ